MTIPSGFYFLFRSLDGGWTQYAIHKVPNKKIFLKTAGSLQTSDAFPAIVIAGEGNITVDSDLAVLKKIVHEHGSPMCRGYASTVKLAPVLFGRTGTLRIYSRYLAPRLPDHPGTISTYAGGRYGFGRWRPREIGGLLAAPKGMSVDAVGNLYMADDNDNRVRIVSPQ
jgi:hypothetical protein